MTSAAVGGAQNGQPQPGAGGGSGNSNAGGAGQPVSAAQHGAHRDFNGPGVRPGLFPNGGGGPQAAILPVVVVDLRMVEMVATLQVAMAVDLQAAVDLLAADLQAAVDHQAAVLQAAADLQVRRARPDRRVLQD